jgi:hypothetical protein
MLASLLGGDLLLLKNGRGKEQDGTDLRDEERG